MPRRSPFSTEWPTFEPLPRPSDKGVYPLILRTGRFGTASKLKAIHTVCVPSLPDDVN
jgi:hypothetical protein